MRIIVFFDLPTVTSLERREYSQFRKFLIKSGFMMMQESIYCKLALNSTAVEAVMSNVRKNKPGTGLIQMLVVTERQFSNIEFVLGSSRSEVLDTDKRLVFL